MHSFGLIKQREDRICRRNLGAVVQVGVDVAGGGDVAVTKPLLNILQGNAVGIEQAGAGMPQIMEADFLHPVALQNQREMLGQEARRDELAHLVDIDIVQVTLVIALAAEPPVLRLLRFFTKQGVLKGLYQRKCPIAGFCLGAILLDNDALAVQRGLRDRVLDGDRLLLKVDGVPSQAQHFAALQPIEGSQHDGKLNQITLCDGEQLLQLLVIVGAAHIFHLLRPLDPIRRIDVDEPSLEGILKRFADVGMTVDHFVCRHIVLGHFPGVVILNVLRGDLGKRQCREPSVEVWIDFALDCLHIGGVGRNLDAVFHHLQPVKHELREQNFL